MLQELNRTTAQAPQHRPVKIVQFGGGNFLRGFADWAIDILNERTGFNGAIDIIQSHTAGTSAVINSQQGLYHLIIQGYEGGRIVKNTRLITSVNRAVNPSENFSTFLHGAENPELRFIFSNTTETGISFDERDHDPGQLAKTFPGKLTQLLYHRFRFFKGSDAHKLVIIPCELIEKNGEELRKTVLRYSAHWKLEHTFVQWIEGSVFCNTLVDRIVPGYPTNAGEYQRETGFNDQLLVAAEPFYFWAIEAPESVKDELNFAAAGLNNIVFVKDLTPYRTRKVRILNGIHTALMPVAYLRGIRTVREAMDDPYMSAFIHNTIEREIIPTLDLPQDEVTQFARDVEDRFRNPFIKHQLISIALNSISKFNVRILPTLETYVHIKQEVPPNIIQSLAALLIFYRGEWNNEPIALNDSPEMIGLIQEAWTERTPEAAISKILRNVTLWGKDLTQLPGIENAVTEAAREILSTRILKSPRTLL